MILDKELSHLDALAQVKNRQEQEEPGFDRNGVQKWARAKLALMRAVPAIGDGGPIKAEDLFALCRGPEKIEGASVYKADFGLKKGKQGAVFAP